MRKITGFTILLFISGIPAVVFALGTENFGDRPIEVSSDWPNGMKKMLDSPGRVYSRWVNGGEYFCYKGDISAFNEVLKKFADINTIRHQLIIDYNCGQTKSFDGKEIGYDWRLDFIGGISRAVKLKEGASEVELSPKLTYCLCREETRLDRLILPENVEMTLSDPNRGSLMDYRLEQAVKWRTAKRKWLEFVKPYLENQRKRLEQTWPAGQELPMGGYVEFQSQRISKYLSNYQIYLIETNLASASKLFAVSADGNVFDLKGDEFNSIDGKGAFRNESFSKFISIQRIKVENTNAAIEIGKFIEELAFAPNRWMFIRHNSNNFKVFKSWIFSSAGTVDDETWLWFTEKQANGWMVSRKYVGPPASIMVPPKWNLICNDKKQIIEIVHY
jgi:hypothetical protein